MKKAAPNCSFFYFISHASLNTGEVSLH